MAIVGRLINGSGGPRLLLSKSGYRDAIERLAMRNIIISVDLSRRRIMYACIMQYKYGRAIFRPDASSAASTSKSSVFIGRSRIYLRIMDLYI